MAKKKGVRGASKPRVEELLLHNLGGLVQSPAEFYRWYHRRLKQAAEELPGLANWDRVAKCKDVRFRAKCNNWRVCPYCALRKLTAEVWPKWYNVHTEIYMVDEIDDLNFSIFVDAINIVAGGCQWFRQWHGTAEHKVVQRAIFLVPCGDMTLRAQEATFLELFGVQPDFLTCPTEAWIGSLERNLSQKSSGMVGCVRGGKLKKLPVKPPLRDLHPGLYSTLAATADFEDGFEDAAAIPQELNMTANSQSPTVAAEQTAREQRVFWSLAYYALRQFLHPQMTRQAFVEQAPTCVDTLQRVVATTCPQLGINDQTVLLQIMDVYNGQVDSGQMHCSFEDFLGMILQNQEAQRRQQAMQLADQALSQPAPQIPPQPPAPPPLVAPPPVVGNAGPGGLPPLTPAASPVQPPQPQQGPTGYVPQPPPVITAQPQQFYQSPGHADQVRAAIVQQHGQMVQGLPMAPQPGQFNPDAAISAMGLYGAVTDAGPAAPAPQQPQPVGQGAPTGVTEQPPFEASGQYAPPAAQVPDAVQATAPIPPGLPSTHGWKIEDHVQFDLGTEVIRGFVTRVDGHMVDIKTEQGHEYNQCPAGQIKRAEGPVQLHGVVNFDAYMAANQFAEMTEAVPDRAVFEVLQEVTSVKTVTPNGQPMMMILDVINSDAKSAESPGPFYICYLSIGPDQGVLARMTSKVYLENWQLTCGNQAYVLSTPRPDETTRKTIAAPKKGTRTKKTTKKATKADEPTQLLLPLGGPTDAATPAEPQSGG